MSYKMFIGKKSSKKVSENGKVSFTYVAILLDQNVTPDDPDYQEFFMQKGPNWEDDKGKEHSGFEVLVIQEAPASVTLKPYKTREITESQYKELAPMGIPYSRSKDLMPYYKEELKRAKEKIAELEKELQQLKKA